ncbi:GNAT family N-acetyltransferase [Tolypothrix sp. VBCCA 56010]|uniref:GNAT family N-acetyltransferase n=1 Tax=Tolypothrix sp. VBCCA 56010 TaxID=3137731 RepID=UPI003D7DE4FA
MQSKVSDSDVTLVPFRSGDAALLSRWLRAPHVAQWYPEPQEHLDWALCPPVGGERAAIAVNGARVGYLRWQVVSREILDSVGLKEIPANSVDIDMLIGETSYVGRGIGPQALRLLIERLREDPSHPLLGLTTSIHNHAAQRAYRKAGFRDLREYDPPGYGRCLLMVLELG